MSRDLLGGRHVESTLILFIIEEKLVLAHPLYQE